MENIFIGWSGNKPLADMLAQIINCNSNKKAIVGGGSPKDMYIGAQVLNQINRSNFAVLLVEDKEDGQVSNNLMFEWGYIMAKLSIDNICTILINKSSRDLPSDLLGTWVFELTYDKTEQGQKELVDQIYEIIDKNFGTANNINYFDFIDGWKQIFVRVARETYDDDQELCVHILMGCLAAYYYMDNASLRYMLNNVSGSMIVNEVVNFSKSYIDLFLESANMTKPITQDMFFKLIQTYETVLNGKRDVSEELALLMEMLCYNAYGLACILFLRNEDLDNDTINFCLEKSKSCFMKYIELVDEFEKKNNKSECLILLLRSYLYNDLAHLYRDGYKEDDQYKEYLKISVEQRNKLHQTFKLTYPYNIFLATKLEQEYIIALSEQCNFMEDSFMKTMCKKTIVAKYEEWQKELIYTSSLTDRIKSNIDKANANQ